MIDVVFDATSPLALVVGGLNFSMSWKGSCGSLTRVRK